LQVLAIPTLVLVFFLVLYSYLTLLSFKTCLYFYLTLFACQIKSKLLHNKKPIHAAAKAGYKDIVEFFLSKGIGVDDADDDKWTPLHYAARYNHLELCEFLLGQHANIEAKNKNNKTPLDLARERNHMEIVSSLMQPQLGQKMTAVAEETIQKVKNLIEQSANIEAKDMDISNDNLKSDRRASSNDSLESDGDTAPGTTVKEAKVESYAKSRKVQRQ
ncbi:ankyrin repeat domain-containing protein, partial [Wolbachia endosymbiont of Nasonia vitripennis]|uniref:ankyrin repeat domain-containing protein n=1 Tax=Wolbachia endosymbiont of Nasonia vitripennis TaxID=180837 RepID=UPI003A888CCA